LGVAKNSWQRKRRGGLVESFVSNYKLWCSFRPLD